MAKIDVVEFLGSRGLKVRLDGENLRVLPKEKITDDDRTVIRIFKPEILASLKAATPAHFGPDADVTSLNLENYRVHSLLTSLHDVVDRLIEEASDEKLEQMTLELAEIVSVMVVNGNIPENVAGQLAARERLAHWLQNDSGNR